MSLPMVLLHRQGQPNRDRHTLVQAVASRLNGPVVGGNESTGDPKSQSEARSYLRMTISTEELLSQQSTVVGVKAGPLIDDRNDEMTRLKMPPDHDGRLRWRIFRRIIENLSQCSFHQN